MVKVFLDANVLFSASNRESYLSRLIGLLQQRHEALTSDYAAEEARRNIERSRPAWSAGLSALMASVRVVASVQFELPVTLAEKDQPILCTAIRSGCNYLVTGDKRDFGHLYDHTVEGTTVITLLRLAELLVREEQA